MEEPKSIQVISPFLKITVMLANNLCLALCDGGLVGRRVADFNSAAPSTA